jgi:AcrR family transcriptional regulator
MNECLFIIVVYMRIRDENKTLALQNAALQMIVEEGFKGLSMQKLAKQANVSPATIYIHYKDREDLLNKLYLEVIDRTNQAALVGFNPAMSFAEGLKVLWINRFRYYTKHPQDFYFIEQFINSPLIKGIAAQEDQTYRTTMQQFYQHAVAKLEVLELPLEIYWPMAFAPLYQLIKFHLQQTIHPQPAIEITEQKLLISLDLVLKALKP